MKILIILSVCVAPSLGIRGVEINVTPNNLKFGCKDNISHCSRYDKSRYCYDPHFRENCRKYCGYCTGTSSCVDESMVCERLNENNCNDNWVKQNCKRKCGYCDKEEQCMRHQVALNNIIEGKTAAPSWPWQVTIYRNGHLLCGGAIVSRRWIVTAANCIKEEHHIFTVFLDDLVRSYFEPNKRIQEVSRIIFDPNYDNSKIRLHSRGRLFTPELVLLELKKPLKFGKRAQPICLAKKGETPAFGSTCYQRGWMANVYPQLGGFISTLSYEFESKIQSQEKCHEMKNYAESKEKMLCASNNDVMFVRNCLNGLHGDPLVCQNKDGSWTLQGISIWPSTACNVKDAPASFSRVGFYRTWMDQYIN